MSDTRIILFSSIVAFDGLDETPLHCVDAVGTAESESDAIDLVTKHFDAQNIAGALAAQFADKSRMLVHNPGIV